MPSTLPQSLVGEHYDNSREYVKKALMNAGCTEDMFTDIMFTACAVKVVENKMPITYPSATGCTERCMEAMKRGMKDTLMNRAYRIGQRLGGMSNSTYARTASTASSTTTGKKATGKSAKSTDR